MQITRETQGPVTILALSGQLDATTAAQLETALIDAYDGGTRLFVLECSGLTYISSAGLRILLKVYKQIKPMNGVLALATLQPHIWDIFKLTGFSNIFPIHDSQGEALRALVAPPR
jgi:anti-anti-sigma factor